MFDVVMKEYDGKSIKHLLYHILAEIHSLKNFLKMTNEELVTFLDGLTAEVGAVKTVVDQIEAAINAAPADSVPQPVIDSVTNLKTALDGLAAAAVLPGSTTV